MSDPVAEAAAQLAQPTFLEKIEAKVEGIFRSDTPAPTAETPAELPNAASGAAEPTAAPASAPNAAGSDITSPTAASSDEPLHTRIAQHLEAIFSMTRAHEAASGAAAMQAATDLKAKLDELHAEMMQKLQTLFHML